MQMHRIARHVCVLNSVSASVGSSSTDPLPASVASSSTDPLPVKKGVKRQARPIVDSDDSSDSDADIGIGKRPTRPIVDSDSSNDDGAPGGDSSDDSDDGGAPGADSSE